MTQGRRVSSFFLHPHMQLSNKQFSILMSVAIFMLLVDVSLLKSSVFITPTLHEYWNTVLFALVSIVLVALQYLILNRITSVTKHMRIDETFSLRAIRMAVIVGQYAVFAIIGAMIIQMLVSSYFSTILLTMVVGVSYALSTAALSLLAFRFLSWFRSSSKNRNILVLLYGVSSAALALNVIITLSFAVVILNDKNPQIMPHAGVYWLSFSKGSLKDFLNQAYIASSIVSFIFMWVSTTLLLRYYSQTFGKTRYWIILSVPLAYFLSQFLVFSVDISESLSSSDPTFTGLILSLAFVLTKPAGGILFGVAFWIVSRKLDNDSIVKSYMMILAYGLILSFTSNQAVVLVATSFYPPFGTATVSYMALSSYLILVGVYFSAVSISQDRKVLRNIRSSALNELKLLESISSAESQERIQNRVTNIAKRHQEELVEGSGVQSALDEQDMKNYLNDVIREVSLQKESSGSGSKKLRTREEENNKSSGGNNNPSSP
jgi:hypothetical protein